MITLPPWLDREAWDGFVAMRKALKVPFTDRAAKLIIKRLSDIREAGHNPNDALDQSTLNGWRDVYVPNRQEIAKKPASATQDYLRDLESHRAAANSPEAHQARLAALSSLKMIK